MDDGQPDVEPHTYPERRAAMVDRTRQRILDAVVATLARGVSELTIPAVAREARVSIPTVYRHFRDKRALVTAAGEALRERRGQVLTGAVPLERFGEFLTEQYTRSASVPETVRAALDSEIVRKMRREQGDHVKREQRLARVFAPVLADRTAADRRHLVRLVTVLCSSSMVRAFRDVLDVGPAEAASTVWWAVRQLAGLDERGKPRRAKGRTR